MRGCPKPSLTTRFWSDHRLPREGSDLGCGLRCLVLVRRRLRLLRLGRLDQLAECVVRLSANHDIPPGDVGRYPSDAVFSRVFELAGHFIAITTVSKSLAQPRR